MFTYLQVCVLFFLKDEQGGGGELFGHISHTHGSYHFRSKQNEAITET